MRRMSKWVAGGALTVAMVGTGGGFALPDAAGDHDKPLTSATLAQAAAAALASSSGGTVVETEVGDDGAVYGVEIVLSDGRQVEITLDGSFKVIARHPDDDGRGGDGN